MRSARPLCYALGLGASLLLSACFQSSLKKDFGASALEQSDLDNGTLRAWLRSPVVDGKDSDITATDESTVARVPVTPLKIDSLKSTTTPMASAALTLVIRDKILPKAFTALAGKVAPWPSTDHQTVMAYHHGNKALKYAQRVLPFSAIQARYPFKLVISRKGNATGTSYNPSDKTTTFYLHSQGSIPNFNPVDEADSIYHELGHAVQDTVAPELLNVDSGKNLDLDTLLEGLADFYAAALADDDNILLYLRNNYPALLAESSKTASIRLDRNGPITRTLRHSLSFPSAWTDDAHLDGRIVAAALNDFRRYLTGETIQTLAPARSFSKAIAFERVVQLSYGLLGDYTTIGEDVTLYRYAKKLVELCGSANLSNYVPSGFTFTATECTALETLLTARGLIRDTGELYDDNGDITFGQRGDATPSPDIVFETTGGFLEVNTDGRKSSLTANFDKIEECEAVMLFPNLTNVSAGDFYSNLSFIDAIGEFKDLRKSGRIIDDLVSSSQGPKLLGWLPPNGGTDQTKALAATPTSIWHLNNNVGASFTRFPSISTKNPFFPSPVGWMAAGPGSSACSDSNGCTFNVSYSIEVRPYRSYSTNVVVASPAVVQSYTIYPSANGYCSVSNL